MNVGISVTHGVGDLKEVDTQLLSRLGFGAVFVACYEDEVRWRVDDLASFVRRARNDGLQPYAVPCGYGKFLDPDPSIESLYVQTHPDTCQLDSRGRRLRKACPNHPQYLEWFSSSMRTLAWLLECRGFVWDEPGFHWARGRWSCRCKYCARLFEGTYGHEMPHELTDELLEFRASAVVMFILAAVAAIHSVDRRLQSLVIPSPRIGTNQPLTGNENIGSIVQCASLDGLCMIVPWQELGWDMEHGVREAMDGAAKVCHRADKGCAVWVAASPRPEDRVLDTIEFAAKAGADALILADYASLVQVPDFPLIREPLSELLHTAAAK